MSDIKSFLKKYLHKDLAKKDLQPALLTFTSLKISRDNLILKDGKCRLLAKFTGFLPVPYEGTIYSFPIDVYFLENHPISSPIVYLCPTNIMIIKENKHVDSKGLVYHSYLSEWNYPQSNTKTLLQHLQIAFGESPPLFANEIIKQQSNQSSTLLRKKREIIPVGKSYSPSLYKTLIQYTGSLYETQCAICKEDVTNDNIYRVLSCNCIVCKECFKDHLENQVNRLPALQWKCGVCGLPKSRDDVNDKHRRQLFSSWRLFIQKEYCFIDKINEKFEEKICDVEILTIPGANCCVKCKSISKEDSNQNEKNPIKCRQCQTVFCRFCNAMWTKEHESMSCVEMMKIQLGDQMEFIQCSKCRMVTEKVYGNCEHFDCKRCNAQFCPCGIRFFNGEECLVFGKRCGNLGFHGHHPRNCFTDLRNIDVEKLKLLITVNNLSYTRKGPASKYCNMVVGLNEALCDKDAFEEKLCPSHFKAHLTKIIQENHLDPLDVLTKGELILCYKRFYLSVPIKLSDTSKEQYRLQLIGDLQRRWPLQEAVPQSN